MPYAISPLGIAGSPIGVSGTTGVGVPRVATQLAGGGGSRAPALIGLIPVTGAGGPALAPTTHADRTPATSAAANGKDLRQCNCTVQTYPRLERWRH
jgi:hypothetical protein